MDPILRIVSPWRVVPEREVPTFKGYFRVEVFGHEDVIYEPATATARVYLLKRGRVRIKYVAHNGARSVMCILGRGDLFGDPFKPKDEVPEAAIASGNVEVWSMAWSDFSAQLDHRADLAMDVIRAYADRERALKRHVASLTFREVPARLADILLMLKSAHGEPCVHGEGDMDLRDITQQDLADLVGASRPFVSTLVNDMKRDGVLKSVGRVLCIHNPKALRQLAAVERVREA